MWIQYIIPKTGRYQMIISGMPIIKRAVIEYAKEQQCQKYVWKNGHGGNSAEWRAAAISVLEPTD